MCVWCVCVCVCVRERERVYGGGGVGGGDRRVPPPFSLTISAPSSKGRKPARDWMEASAAPRWLFTPMCEDQQS